MDDDGPDLDAWTFGKIAALMPKVHSDAAETLPQSIRNSSHDDAPQESQCCVSSHEQYDSNESQGKLGGILKMHRIDLPRVSFLQFRRMAHV